MKYIDADKLKEIVDRVYKQYEYDYGLSAAGSNMRWIYDAITSLQQEQPELPGIEKPGIPGKDFIPIEWVDACEKYGKWKIIRAEEKSENPTNLDLEKEIENAGKDVLRQAHYHNKIFCIPQTMFDDVQLMDIYKSGVYKGYELGLNSKK